MASGARRGEYLMTKTVQITAVFPSRDIHVDKLMLSQTNVRRIKAGLSVEKLAEDIPRRGLLQSLSVRPILDDDDTEHWQVRNPGWGSSLPSTVLAREAKALAKTAPIPCVVREAGSAILAEEDSLEANIQRVALHPLNQFRASVSHDKSQSDAEITAAFFVTPQIVKERPKLASVASACLKSTPRMA